MYISWSCAYCICVQSSGSRFRRSGRPTTSDFNWFWHRSYIALEHAMGVAAILWNVDFCCLLTSIVWYIWMNLYLALTAIYCSWPPYVRSILSMKSRSKLKWCVLYSIESNRTPFAFKSVSRTEAKAFAIFWYCTTPPHPSKVYQHLEIRRCAKAIRVGWKMLRLMVPMAAGNRYDLIIYSVQVTTFTTLCNASPTLST